MPTIYISDSGDDKNDGLSLQTPIYSFKRAKELHGGRNDCSWHFGPRAWKRIQKELSEKDKRPIYVSRDSEAAWAMAAAQIALTPHI